MALTIGNGTITGLNQGGLPDNSINKNDLAVDTMKYQWGYNNKGTLLTGIRDSSSSTLRTFNINSYVSTFDDTSAIVLRLRYIHNGGTDHGYWGWRASQSGNSHYAESSNAHYDWYYNTDNYHIYVPWDGTGSTTLNIQNTDAYNNSSSNYYELYVEGIVRGGI